MKLDRFINRPVLSTVISILIVILGAIGLATLPITQYPDIAPPTVSVRATYTGASASTVLNSVIAPLEEQINGVENMMYMTSTASNTGSGDISIYFKQGTDPDMAAVNVQNRVSMAQGLLPAEVGCIHAAQKHRRCRCTDGHCRRAEQIGHALLSCHSAAPFRSQTVTRVPCPGALSICKVLPCTSAMRLQSASPRPLPPCLRARDLSTM